MSNKGKNSGGNSLVSIVLGGAVLIIGILIYAVTGVDFLGVLNGDDTSSAPSDPPPALVATGDVSPLEVGLGLGAEKDFWQVYFTSPSNSRDRSQYTNGVDVPLASVIGEVQNTLDIAAFELNNEVITQAILDAHERGVQVRMVVDDEHVLEDDDSTIAELQLAGVPIVDDSRSALMHNKFLIMDGLAVWTGSMNLTVNGVYRNNNNAIFLRSAEAVRTYQAEFDEMFLRGEFGRRSDPSNTANYTESGTPIEIHFASENEVVEALIRTISTAQSQIRFMTFSFTRDDLGQALLAEAESGVDVEGVFETTGSQTRFSEMGRLFCAGLPVFQDGNNGVLHHKVFIIDGQTVITGSFNYSNNAVENNDENVVIIRDPDLANLYLQEYERIKSIARTPDPEDLDCG